MSETERGETRIVRNVNASMRAEGFYISQTAKEACFAVASGKQTASRLIKERLAEYAAKRK